MFTIIYDFGSYLNNRISFEDRDEANSIWTRLKEAGATNMRHESSKPKHEKRMVVRVTFTEGGKPYTYLTHTKVAVGKQALVYTNDGLKIVTVIDSGEMTDSELAKICPLSKFKYIEGIVSAA